VVAGADEGAGLDVFEAEGFAEAFVSGELVGADPSGDGQVVAGGLKVLADGEDIAGCGGDDIAHELFDLGIGFADADHDAGFGGEVPVLGAAEQFDGAVVFSLGPHDGVEAADGFHVVVEDFGSLVEDELQGVPVAAEVGDEDFDGGIG